MAVAVAMTGCSANLAPINPTPKDNLNSESGDTSGLSVDKPTPEATNTVVYQSPTADLIIASATPPPKAPTPKAPTQETQDWDFLTPDSIPRRVTNTPTETPTIKPPRPTRIPAPTKPPTVVATIEPTSVPIEFPPTPPGAPIRGPWDTVNRDIFLSHIAWFYKQDSRGPWGQGQLLDWRLEGNVIFLSIDTDHGEGGVIEFSMAPSENQPFGVVAARERLIPVYQTTKVELAFAALKNYLMLGDPIGFFKSLDGRPAVAGNYFQVTTWR